MGFAWCEDEVQNYIKQMRDCRFLPPPTTLCLKEHANIEKCAL